MSEPNADMEALRKVAEEATPGPWVAKSDASVKSLEPGHWGVTGPCLSRRREANARFIATFDPPTVLSLLSELEAVKGENAWPIMLDGPHKIDEHRLWLARQLLDSKLSAEEAYGIVRHSPAISAEAALVSLKGGGGSSSASLPAAPDGATEAQNSAGKGERHRFGSPPEPVVNPSEAWCDAYADWYYQGRG